MSVDSGRAASWNVESNLKIRVLLEEEHIILQTNYERQIFNMLKNRPFEHTHTYEDGFLDQTSVLGDFQAAFHAVGWDNFCDIQ